jgi:uncharacterized protein
MSLERYGEISQVTEWPADPRHNVFLTRGWMSSVQGVLSSRQAYLLNRDDAGRVRASAVVYDIGPDTFYFFNPLGIAASHLRDESLLALCSEQERQDAARLAGRLEETGALAPSASSTAPFGFTHGFSAVGGPESIRPVVRELDVLRQEWDARCSAVMYVEERHTDLRTVLTEEGYTPFKVGADCVLPIDFASFDEYVEKARAPRKKLRRERGRFLEADYTVAVEPAEDNLDEIAHLQALLQEKYGRPYDYEGERAVFVSVLENIGEYANLLVARQGGKLRAFAMFFEKDGVIHVKMTARDVDQTDDEHFVHFNVGYYEVVEEALRRGAREINYGPEAYRAKLRRGCVPRGLYWYVKGPEEAAADLAAAGELVSAMYSRMLDGIVG